MKKWIRKYIEHNRPALASNQGFAWPLWTTRLFGLAIVLRYRSDSTFDLRNEGNRLIVVVEGEYLDHYEIPRTGKHEPAVKTPKDAYVYGNEDGLFVCMKRSPGDVVFKREDKRGGVELMSPETTEDRIIDWPDWMQHYEVIFDAERPVLWLMLVWGMNWR